MSDLEGKRFGRLTAIRCVGRNKWRDSIWECSCDCGNVTTVSEGHLKDGHTTSCGCFAREERSRRATRHGLLRGGKKPRTFIIWNDMKARCFNPRSVSYPRYGARGISVCDEWLDYETFNEWAMAHGYADGLELDRIDNDGPYCPSNCRWVTRSRNQRNTSRTHMVTISGKTKCVSDWISELGISKSTFYQHLNNDPDGGQRYFIERYCMVVA
ncbi:hypothetical protein ACTQ1D_01835 [Parafannyhessea umbonata]|uniref:hypothetical protein n=1 Tax=Parafannyhessea umbonata TaxID=604330 RepID=UPI003F9C9B2F